MLRGEESQGMLLAASDAAGVVLLRPDRDCAPGSKVK
jgi:tRNA-binding EMAP/Myf-like protein